MRHPKFASIIAAAALAALLAACSAGGGGALSPGLTAPMNVPGAQLNRVEALFLLPTLLSTALPRGRLTWLDEDHLGFTHRPAAPQGRT